MPVEENTPAPEGAPLTDEQIAEQFPGDNPEHVRAMLDKAAGKGSPVSPNADEPEPDADAVVYPDYIPEKFRTGTVDEAHAAMAAGHAELEARLGTGTDDDDDAGDDDSEGDEGDNGDAPDAFSLEDVESEFIANDGKISAETYAAAEAAGMPKAVLDSYVAGQQAIAEQLVSRVHEVAGGEESYSKMLTWATNNWSDAEVQAFDSTMETGNEVQISLTVRGLKAAFEADQGRAPKLTHGDTGQPAATGTYKSKAEMTTDMKDPRYKTDPAFRATVAAKLAASDIW